MKRETAEELAATALEPFRIAISQVPDWPEGRKVMEDTAKEFLVQKLLPLAEPSADGKAKIKQQLKSMKAVARTDFLKIAKALPKNPGGRHKALTSEKIANACSDMAALLYKGVEKIDARNRIAARYGISPWTMGRYWREYQQSVKIRDKSLK